MFFLTKSILLRRWRIQIKKDEVEISDQLLQDYLAIAKAPENLTDSEATLTPVGSVAASTAAALAAEEIASSSSADKNGTTPIGVGDKSSDAAPEKIGEARTNNVSSEVISAIAFVTDPAFDIGKYSATTMKASVVTLNENI